jgi:hypothetical protein
MTIRKYVERPVQNGIDIYPDFALIERYVRNHSVFGRPKGCTDFARGAQAIGIQGL